jgi:hypothetical protein
MKLAALWLGVGSIDCGWIVGYTEVAAKSRCHLLDLRGVVD